MTNDIMQQTFVLTENVTKLRLEVDALLQRMRGVDQQLRDHENRIKVLEVKDGGSSQ